MTWVTWPTGHYYSPVPSSDDIARAHGWRSRPDFLRSPGVALDAASQWSLLSDVADGARSAGFSKHGGPGQRYQVTGNGMFGVADAAILSGLMVVHHPQTIIEIGSGFSTAAMLDVIDFLDLETRVTAIEPFPVRLESLLPDSPRLTLIEEGVQDVDLTLFDGLSSNDILFIDSSHVGKAGSDVNWELFEVLPRLQRGVLIHVHDIFPGFEYPARWHAEGHYWNEAYLLRAFLQYNSAFEIVLWPALLAALDRGRLTKAMPTGNLVGGSLWLRRN